MFLLYTFGEPIDVAIVSGAQEALDLVTPLGRYFARRPSRDGLAVGICRRDVGEIRRGVRELAGVLEAAVRGRDARSARAGASRAD